MTKEEQTKRVPRELVAERVTGALRGRQTTTVRQERGDLSTLVVDLLDGLDSV